MTKTIKQVLMERDKMSAEIRKQKKLLEQQQEAAC